MLDKHTLEFTRYFVLADLVVGLCLYGNNVRCWVPPERSLTDPKSPYSYHISII